MKVETEGYGYWMLYKDVDEYILSVLCGSIGLYTCEVALSVHEISEYESMGDKAIDRLAADISGNPAKYQSRQVAGFSLNEKARLAAKEWRDSHP